MVINPIIGFYIPIIRIPIKGGMTIPNIATFDHGTYIVIIDFLKKTRAFQYTTSIHGTISSDNNTYAVFLHIHIEYAK